MSMSRKDFRKLAETMIGYDITDYTFLEAPIFLKLVRFCKTQNPRFDEARFLHYCHSLIYQNVEVNKGF